MSCRNAPNSSVSRPSVGIAGLLGQHQRVGRDPTAVALGVRILGLDRLGQPEQRLAVRLLELEVAVLELLGPLLDHHVEQRAAALEPLVLGGQPPTSDRCSSTSPAA
jgi:hypothetical protein